MYICVVVYCAGSYIKLNTMLNIETQYLRQTVT